MAAPHLALQARQHVQPCILRHVLVIKMLIRLLCGGLGLWCRRSNRACRACSTIAVLAGVHVRDEYV